MERQEYVYFSVTYRGPVHGYHKAAASVCSALKAWAELLQGVQIMLHMLSITAISVRCVLGYLFLHLSLQWTSTSWIRKRTSWQAFLGKKKDLSWVLGCQGASVGLPGHTACPAIQSLHGCVQLCFLLTPSRHVQTLAHDPWCCWPRDEMCSMHQISALSPRQRHAQEQGKAKPQGDKALISAAPPWKLLGKWLNFTAELSKMSSYQIHFWVFRLN